MSAFIDVRAALPARRVLEHFLGPARKNWTCPFHPDKTPSLTAHGPAIRCFGCGWAGDLFRFLEDYLSVGRGEALRMAADLAGIVLPALPKAKHATHGPSPAQVMAQVCRDIASIDADIIRRVEIEAARLWRQAWAVRGTDAVWDIVADGTELDRRVEMVRMQHE